MASVGNPIYWCYQCSRTVSSSGSGDLVCPHCHGGFLEEMDPHAADIPPPPPLNNGPGADTDAFPPFQGFGQRPRTAPAIAQLLETMASFFQQMQTPPYPGPEEHGSRARSPDPSNLFGGQMQRLLGSGNVEVYFDTGNGSGPRRLTGNIGDYFFGPGLDQLIQQLTENDPNRFGTPPAAKSAIEAMPKITIAAEHLGTDSAHCAVCKDEYELGTEVWQMPCKHMYHADCILPWLAQHNSCPVCRFEMPTDDPEYDQARGGGQQGASAMPEMGGVQSGGERGGMGSGGSTTFRPYAAMAGRASDGSVRRNIAASRQDERTDVSSTPETTNVQQGVNSGPTGAGSGANTRRFSITFPWPFRTTTSQSPANAQAESSGQANSTETVSSRPSGNINETTGQASRPRRTDDDGDTVMSEGSHEDLIQ